jgi:hypothetical protein
MTATRVDPGFQRPAGGDPSLASRFRPELWAVAAVGFAALVAVLYLASVHVTPNSDGATVVLEGRALSSGKLFLHGWDLSTDSFWLVDAPFYAVAAPILGLGPQLLHLVPAVIAATVITVSVLLACRGRRGWAAFAATMTVLSILALPGPALSSVLLLGPLHVATILWCLLAFAGLRRGGFGWGWAGAVVVLAAGLLGDLLILVMGAIPVALAGAVVALRTREWRAAVPAVGAAGCALALAAVVRTLTTALGGFTVTTAHDRASKTQMLSNLEHIPQWGAQLLGVGDAVYGRGGIPAGLQALHVVLIVLTVAAVVAALVAMVRGALVPARSVRLEGRDDPGTTCWFLDEVLCLAFFADLALFVYLTVFSDRSYERYLTGAVVFAAILAGRLVARTVDSTGGMALRKTGTSACVALFAGVAAGFGFYLASPRPVTPAQQLGRFLEAKGLDEGVGDYWSASITTVETGGKVEVRPVIADPGDRIVRYGKQSAAGWYENGRFQFLVYDTSPVWDGVDAVTATATFGQPAHVYTLAPYIVVVWRAPISVSTVGYAP